jgi:hypothetical protein
MAALSANSRRDPCKIKKYSSAKAHKGWKSPRRLRWFHSKLCAFLCLFGETEPGDGLGAPAIITVVVRERHPADAACGSAR